MQKTLFAIALASVMAAGCGGGGGGTAKYVQKGMTAYDRADYRGALNEFAVVHGGEGALNQRTLARYYVYQGLTEYHLDRRSEALADLNRGRDIIERGSGKSWLRKEISVEMEQALAELSAEPSASGGSTPPSTSTASPAEPAKTASPPSTGDALVPVKTAAPASAAPVKTATTSPAPAKTTSPPTKTLSSSQSTSPK